MTTTTSYHKDLSLKMGHRPPGYLITVVKRAKTGGKGMYKLYITLVGSAPRASKVAPKQLHLATTIASPSTTLALTPRRQGWTIVGVRCDSIT